MPQADQLNLLARLCSLERAEADLPSLTEADVKSLASAAESEGVSGWLLHRLTESYADWTPAPALAKLLRPAAIATVVHNAHVLGVVRDIEAKLADIPTVRLKGIALIESPYYADASLRLAGDIDLWTQPDRIYEAREILRNSGADAHKHKGRPLEAETDAHLDGFDYKGISVELHRRLFRKYFDWDLPGSVADYATTWRGRRILRPDAMAYHLMTHAYKHYVWQTICLKWVIDIAIVLDKADNLEDILGLLRDTSADSAKTMHWAVGIAMPLLPVAKAKELQAMGFSPLIYAENISKGHVSTFKTKVAALELLTSGIRTRMSQAHGFRGKMKAIADFARYEAQRTRDRYPQDCLAIGIIKRIVKKK